MRVEFVALSKESRIIAEGRVKTIFGEYQSG